MTSRATAGTWLVAALLTTALGALAAGTRPFRELPAKYQRSPYTAMSLSVGSPTSGWQVRAKRLRGSKALRIKNRERRYLYGPSGARAHAAAQRPADDQTIAGLSAPGRRSLE